MKIHNMKFLTHLKVWFQGFNLFLPYVFLQNFMLILLPRMCRTSINLNLFSGTNISNPDCNMSDPIYIVIDDDESEGNYHDCNENGEDYDVPDNVHGMLNIILLKLSRCRICIIIYANYRISPITLSSREIRLGQYTVVYAPSCIYIYKNIALTIIV